MQIKQNSSYSYSSYKANPINQRLPLKKYIRTIISGLNIEELISKNHLIMKL